MRVINGRQVFVTVRNIHVLNEASGKYEGGFYYAAFRLDAEPGAVVDGEVLRDGVGKTKIFTNANVALKEIMKYAESQITVLG